MGIPDRPEFFDGGPRYRRENDRKDRLARRARSPHHPRPTPEVERAVLFLLALSSRVPDVLREPFEKAARAIAVGTRAKESLSSVLAASPPTLRDPIGQHWWTQDVCPLLGL